MKSGIKVLLGFAAGAAAGYLLSKNSDRLAACFDEVCYKIDDLRDQFADYRNSESLDDECDECECDGEKKCCCAAQDDEAEEPAEADEPLNTEETEL